MKKLLFISIVSLLASCCTVDEDHVVVKTPGGTDYSVKRGTITHTDEGCITFKARTAEGGEKESTVTVCGTYTIVQ